MPRTSYYDRQRTYERILIETPGAIKVEPVSQAPEPPEEVDGLRVGGLTWAGFVAVNAHCVAAVVATRPLKLVLYGESVTIPESWVERSRRLLGVCPSCAMRSALKRTCTHGLKEST